QRRCLLCIPAGDGQAIVRQRLLQARVGLGQGEPLPPVVGLALFQANLLEHGEQLPVLLVRFQASLEPGESRRQRAPGQARLPPQEFLRVPQQGQCPLQRRLPRRRVVRQRQGTLAQRLRLLQIRVDRALGLGEPQRLRLCLRRLGLGESQGLLCRLRRSL